jgi:hypothetical protein
MFGGMGDGLVTRRDCDLILTELRGRGRHICLGDEVIRESFDAS